MTSRNGKTAAPPNFKQVYEANVGLVQFAMSRFRFPIQVQEDLIQDVFLRYLEHAPNLDTHPPKSFLLAVARNLAIDYYRRQRRRHAERHLPMEEVMHELPHEDATEHLKQLLAVQDFLQALRDDPKASTLVQYYDDDLSIREIAERNAESTATVSSRLSRQRQRYRMQLAEHVAAAT
ncbi:RNA polymerase sigma factor [Oligoflexus tunisiensis]|uniref:RNA polymerase sigma factor n=1 Tax=Oligoflexus tunisiensis TaxID=708132 RepID=UPI00114CAEDB|nr:sigma-70 family RNA polymerase sigma factor [Oligoflexus tunisiensis]